jgi:hypothetical protein
MQEVRILGAEKRGSVYADYTGIVPSSGFIALHRPAELKTATEVRAGGREVGTDVQYTLACKTAVSFAHPCL